jgi:hypothetical protein
VSGCNIVPSAARVLRDRVNCVCDTAATVYRRERVPQRFGVKLDSEDGGQRPRGDRKRVTLQNPILDKLEKLIS